MKPRPPRSSLFPYTTLFRSLRAAIAAALDVVLAAHRIDAAALDAQIAGHQREIAKALHVVHAANDRQSGHRGRRHQSDARPEQDRKSTRLNSSHSQISYAVF